MTNQLVVIVPVCDAKVFMLRRKAKHHIGMYEFPAGKVHPNETILEAAQREYFEETGAQITGDIQSIMTTYSPDLSGNGEMWHNTYMLHRCNSNNVLTANEPLIHDSPSWFTMNVLTGLVRTGNVVPTSAFVFEMLKHTWIKG